MCYGWNNGAAVLLVVLSWLVAAALPAPLGAAEPAALLAGLLAVVVATALVLVARTDDPLFEFGRSIRGPTTEERRLHGELRRHFHPDTAGRPRPRAPGPCSGTG